MSEMSLNLFRFSLSLYMVGTVAYIAYLFIPKKWVYRTAYAGLMIGFVLHTGSFTSRISSVGFPPVANLHDALSFMAWAIVGLYLLVLLKYKIRPIGAFISPLAVVLMLSAYSMPKDIEPFIKFYLQSFWLPVHIILIVIGNGFLAVAFSVSIMYLIQEHQLKSKKIGKMYRVLPSLDILDIVNHKSVLWGFPLLTVGVLFGAVVAQQVRGGFTHLGMREFWTLSAWLLYAVLLHTRVYSGWRGRKAAIFSIIAFLFLLFMFFGIKFFIGGGFRFH